MGSTPAPASRSPTAGSFMMPVSSACNLAMISRGVPAGTSTPFHEVASTPGAPPSAVVGSSGQQRGAPRTGDRERAQSAAADMRQRGRYGREHELHLAREQIRSAPAQRPCTARARSSAPPPCSASRRPDGSRCRCRSMPKNISPGRLRERSINSLSDAAGSAGCATMICGSTATSVMGEKSLTGS